jgi:glycosyltransferase involved in cell wall biosynthesis
MAIPAAAPLSPSPVARSHRVAIVTSAGESLRQLRSSLIREIMGRGHRVLVVAPDFRPGDASALAELGADRAVLDPEPGGLRLLSDRKAVAALKATFVNWSPDVVLGCGSKPMVYAALAAKAAGIKRIVVLANALPLHRFSGVLAADEMPAWRYGQALRVADAAVFHNQDDAVLMQRLGILPPSLPTVVVPGAGIDLDRNKPLPLAPFNSGLVFLMHAPLDRRKGITEYCEAARYLRERTPSTRFLLAGAPTEGSHAVSAEGFAGSAVEYHGAPDDPSELLAACHVFVYPSHGEAMPQSVLEAMAAGRPIITSDVTGCRETVDERVNGCLVRPGDAESLATAMESFLKRPDLIPSIARASRAKAERFCGLDRVRGPILTALGLAQ